jgi:hypothetical protein
MNKSLKIGLLHLAPKLGALEANRALIESGSAPQPLSAPTGSCPASSSFPAIASRRCSERSGSASSPMPGCAGSVG